MEHILRGSTRITRIFIIIIAVNIAVWAVCALADVFSGIDLISFLGLPSCFNSALTRFWTPFSYMFVHMSFWHMAFNMLWLWWFGLALSDSLRAPALCLLYLCGGLLGGLFYLSYYLLFPGYGLLCGASAAVMAIMVTAGVLHPNLEIRLWLIGSMRLKWIVTIMVALGFFGLGGGNSGGQAAHLGGVAFGLLYGFCFRCGHDFLSNSVNFVYGVFTSGFRSGKPRINGRRAARVMRDHHRLDALLDRVRNSGYDSLTIWEKAELHRLSRRLD